MLRSFCLAVVALSVHAQTVVSTTTTFDSRACRPGFDQYPFCNTTLPLGTRVNDLISRLELTDIPPLLTARHGGGGSPGPDDNITRLGIPEYDYGVNCVHGVQTSCVKQKDGTTVCPTSFPNRALVVFCLD